MAVRIKFDASNHIIEPTLVLANRNGHRIGPIPATRISVSDSFNSAFECEFRVDKYDNGVEYEYWDQLTDFKLVWCREWNVWFEIYVSVRDDDDTIKDVHGVSVGEAELSQVNLYEIEINTEDDIAREDYVPTILYNPNDPEGSLLHRITEKVPHYTIGHIDNSIRTMQRTFDFNDISIYDALQEISEELDCLFVIDSGMSEDGKIARTINAYDLEAYCIDCGHRHPSPTFVESSSGNYWACPDCGSSNVLLGYGDDTTIFISTENLAEEITFETDTDSVKNCFRLEAGDDLMTAAVMSVNPNGSQYLWYISDELKEDMSPELVSKLAAYDNLYDYYNNEHAVTLPSGIVESYNALISKYHEFNEDLVTADEEVVGFPALMNLYFDTIDFYIFLKDELMPSIDISPTTASDEAAKLTTSSLSPVAVQNLSSLSLATANSSVLAMAKSLVDPNYQVKVTNGVLSGTSWSGNFTITRYADENDNAVTPLISITMSGDYEEYAKQRLQKVLAQSKSDSSVDAVTFFNLSPAQVRVEARKYGLVPLQSFVDICQSCLDLMVQQGLANRDTWADKDPDLYSELYLDYYHKMQYIQEELALRQRELNTVAGQYDSDGFLKSQGMKTAIESERNVIQEALDFEDYLGEDLWLEFASFRREDAFSNSNYISDGLNNRDIIFQAQEFIERARKEIFKSATLQHSLNADLYNLLTIEEFKPIVDYFSTGNWLRIKIDEKVYRLRLIYYGINFDDIENINVEFSDVKQFASGMNDSESIFKQAKSMASSYDAVSRQAGKGEKSNSQLSGWVNNGLSLTNMKIVNSADNQNITWDSHGILGREYLPLTDDYSEKQIKIINRGLYVTDDAWETSKAGIGDFVFWNPRTGQTEEAYGVIADTLVGNLILSEDVGIYNYKNSMTMNEDGLVITADGSTTGGNDVVLMVQKKILDENNEEQLVPMAYLNGDGDLVLTGNVHIGNTAGSQPGTLGAISNTVNQTVNNLTNLSNTVAGNTTSITNLSGRVDGHDTAIGNLSNTVSTQGSTIDSHSTSIAHFNTEILNHQTALDGLSSDVSEIGNQITTMDGQIATIEDVQTVHTQSIDALDGKLGLLITDEELATLNTRTGLKVSQGAIVVSGSTLILGTTAVQRMEAHYNQTVIDIDGLRSSLGALESETDGRFETVHEQVAEYKATIDEFSATISETYATQDTLNNNYWSIQQTQAKIEETASSITTTVTASATESATNAATAAAQDMIDDYTASVIGVFDAIRTENQNGTITYTAEVIRGNENVVSSYPSYAFQWFRLDDRGTETSLGHGYSITVDPDDFEYDGHVVGVFSYYVDNILTLSAGNLNVSQGTLVVRTA